MIDQRFRQDKVGVAAFISITAMVAFNIFAASYQFDHATEHALPSAAMRPVELA